jgi:hypothetical protein
LAASPPLMLLTSQRKTFVAGEQVVRKFPSVKRSDKQLINRS